MMVPCSKPEFSLPENITSHLTQQKYMFYDILALSYIKACLLSRSRQMFESPLQLKIVLDCWKCKTGQNRSLFKQIEHHEISNLHMFEMFL